MLCLSTRIFAIRFATCLIRLNLEARAVILCFFQYAFFCQNCQSSERKIQNFVRTCKTFRACLKNGFRKLRVPVCGRFCPNEGGVAGYGNRMRVKYTAKWGLQIAEMIFQTRSSTFFLHTKACNGVSKTGKRCQFFLRL